MVANAEQVFQACRCDQHRRLTFALQQSIGGDRGSHLHGGDGVGGEALILRDTHHVVNALNRRIVVLIRVHAQQLVRAQGTGG